MIKFDRYVNWCGLSTQDAIELIPKFDLLTDEALIYINSILPADLLNDVDLNLLVYKMFKSTFWLKTNPNFFVKNNGKYFNWKYSETCVEYICIGKIIDGAILPYIERKLNEKI